MTAPFKKSFRNLRFLFLETVIIGVGLVVCAIGLELNRLFLSGLWKECEGSINNVCSCWKG